MEKIKEFFDKNKKIVIPVVIMLVLLIAVGIYFISQPNDNTNKKAENQTEEKVDISQDDKTEDKKDSVEQSTDKPSNDKPTGNSNSNGGNASSNGDDGGSSNHGGNSSASKPSAPSHTHSWKDHTATKQVWVSNIVPVYEDQQVQVGTNKVSLGSYWHCNCGAEVPSSSAKPHIKAHLQAGEPSNGYNQEHFREEPVYETKRVQVGTRDDGHYETQTYVDYKYCDCGAKK